MTVRTVADGAMRAPDAIAAEIGGAVLGLLGARPPAN
jgi:hypothetical protein